MHWLSTAFDGFVGFFPNLIAGLAVLLLGYVIAIVLRRITVALTRRFGLDRVLMRVGIEDKDDPEAGPRWAGTFVFWMVMLITAMQVARAWKLDFVAIGLARILAYVPHVIAAGVIFVAATLFGNWVRERILHASNGDAVAAANDPASQRRIVALAVRAGILALGSFMALRELQIAPEIVTIAFTLTVASIALAASLAFGLGSRGVAGQVAQRWYDRRGGQEGDDPRIFTPDANPDDPSRHHA
jgi:Conserved TM helix